MLTPMPRIPVRGTFFGEFFVTIKTTRLTEMNAVVKVEASTARPVERRSFVVDMHPNDLAPISHAASLMGTTVEDYLLIAAVQHARQVRIDFAVPHDQTVRLAEVRQAEAHKREGGDELRGRFLTPALTLRSA